MHGAPVESTVQQIAWMLVGATLIGIGARRLRIPYSVALVVAGVAFRETHLLSTPRLDPGLLLFAFLPPLLFDAAFRLETRDLRLVIRPVVWLAAPGVLITTILVGAAVWVIVGIPLSAGLLFGGVVAATDPAAVVAVLDGLNVPARITILRESPDVMTRCGLVAIDSRQPVGVAGGAGRGRRRPCHRAGGGRRILGFGYRGGRVWASGGGAEGARGVLR